MALKVWQTCFINSYRYSYLSLISPSLQFILGFHHYNGHFQWTCISHPLNCPNILCKLCIYPLYSPHTTDLIFPSTAPNSKLRLFQCIMSFQLSSRRMNTISRLWDIICYGTSSLKLFFNSDFFRTLGNKMIHNITNNAFFSSQVRYAL